MDAWTGLPTVGMVGGGQLARMTQQAAISLGQSLRVLSYAAHESGARATGDVVVGDERSLDDLITFASDCDVVTFDHELVPTEHLHAMAAKGINLQPSPDALQYAQDKHLMRQRLTELGLPCACWAPIDTAADLARFGVEVGWPVVVKAARGGYDGRGVWVVDSADAGADVLASGVPLIAEEKVAIKRELAALVARSPSGQSAAWPTVETVQEDGICVEVLTPAPGLADETAEAAAALGLRVAASLGVTGVLAVELFETMDGRLVVNELAMRPHNSGHWTIEGARTSQFEQHLRAVLDYPLGATDLAAQHVVMANVLGASAPVGSLDERLQHTLARWPDVKVHLYAKEHRPGRKLGHVTALGTDAADVRTTRSGGGKVPRRWATSMTSHEPTVGVIMGSDSDWSVMSAAADALAEFDVPYEARVVSAHRMPLDMAAYAQASAGRGLKVIIAGAGGAAHLPGMVASLTTLPVIGVPVPLKYLDGMDSLLSIVQMPAGVPVATVSIGGARNAGLLAVRMLAAFDDDLAAKMATFQRTLGDEARAKDANLQQRA